MRGSPRFMAVLYFLLGCVFTYLATDSIKTSVWEFYPLLLIVMATFDFGLAIRLLFFRRPANRPSK
ncbi:YdiK family protein [Ectobacillus ponti]|uniref:YdiK family protein n=1 Tax=Ectobacillus ponti TaxID=2961894 RepID=A0AA41XDI0_9BACI|nr:YdiK family protein [Ectobacillus ponti]MCP8971374.1 YdiK family protein [Ectobacillus ponti]